MLTPFQSTWITSDFSAPNFQHADAPVDFHDGPFQSVVMQVELSSSCFPFSSWGRLPAGQRWPPTCDAFDRNFEFSLDDPAPTGANPGSSWSGPSPPSAGR